MDTASRPAPPASSTAARTTRSSDSPCLRSRAGPLPPLHSRSSGGGRSSDIVAAILESVCSTLLCMRYTIEAEHLGKSFGELRVLEGLDLCVEAGAVFALLGAEGAGKNTPARALF